MKREPAGKVYTPDIQWSKDPAEALEQLMDLYGDAVLRTAYFNLGDLHMAEDVSQEVFLRAYRKWSRFRGESRVLTWLTRITIRVCRDKQRLKSYNESPTDPQEIKGTIPGNVEEQVIHNLRNSRLLEQVMRLSPPLREVIYLYYYLELSTVEIAHALSSPEGTVRARLHRAREWLADSLAKEGECP